jgi:hypothetical protein
LPVREVLRLGNPTLREVAEPVEDPGSPEVTALVADLGIPWPTGGGLPATAGPSPPPRSGSENASSS